MCGLVFALSRRPVRGFVTVAHQRQRYRGPDGEGLLFHETCGIHMGMAHQRLAIVDLTEAGAQPMMSVSGRFRILFNGEIYNFRELGRQFGLDNLRSGTDTEVVVELVERLGIDEAVKHFNGMWALVVQDIEANRFYLSRDRFGKKPLYVHTDSNGIYLASEMHSLLGLPSVSLSPDVITASRFLAQSLQNIDNRSWIDSIKAFPPASIGEIDGADPSKGVFNKRLYWEPRFDTSLKAQCEDDIIDELRELVKDSINLRLHADVPVGVALSGGIDSSIISAISTQQASVKGQCTELFSAVSPGKKDDESIHVDTMSRHLSRDVRLFSLDPDEGEGLFGLLSRCTRHADGPVTSFSSLLFYKLMERAHSIGISVILTGQGADEAFCGYRKYPILEIKRLVKERRILEATALASGFITNGTLLPEFRLTEAKRYIGSSNGSVLGVNTSKALDLIRLGQISSLAERQWLDVEKYSVPYLCHYEDRMSMAWSREVRSPFLDYRVVELGLRMPERLKLRRGWTKYALRKAFEHDLPQSITWRKDKKGFVNPQDDWFKGNLQPIVREVMSRPDAAIYRMGLVDKAGYFQLFDSYCSGRGIVWFRDVFAPFALEVWLTIAAEIERDLKSKVESHRSY